MVDYSNFINVFHSIAEQIPGLYRALIVISAITGVLLTNSGIQAISSSNKAHQQPKAGSYFKVFFGPLMFSLGALLEMGTYTIFRTQTNPIVLMSYTPQSGDDTTVVLYAVRFYITFIGFLLMARATYVGAIGADTKRENWHFEALALYGLAILCYAFDLGVDMISNSVGQGALGTEYFSF